MSKKSKISRINLKSKILFRKYQLLTLSFLILFFIYSVINFFITINKPIKAINIPKIPKIEFTSILKLPYKISDILGAEKIDIIDFVKLINVERLKVGSNPLRMSQTLNKAAQLRADIILKYQNFSHQDPFEGVELTTVLPRLDYHFSYAAENIGMGGLSAQDFVFGFMNSTSHRHALLNPYFQDTGAAVVTGPFKQYYVNIIVQLFTIPAAKDEFLGYSEKDKANYRNLKNQIDGKINPVARFVSQIINGKKISHEEYLKLIRQKEILDILNGQMTQDKPFQNDHVALIMEFNTLL